MFKLERHKHLLARLARTVHHGQLSPQTVINRSQPVTTELLNVNSFNRRPLKHITAEYAAMLRLISRSTGIPTSFVARQLHSSCAQFARGTKSSKTPRKKDEPEKAAPEDPDPPKKNNNDDEDDKKNEKMMSLVTKAVMWMATFYILTLVLAMVLPRKNQPETSTR